MSAAVISFLFSVGASTWFYTKLQRATGNNTKSSVIAAAAGGVVIFFVFFFVFKMIVPNG